MGKVVNQVVVMRFVQTIHSHLSDAKAFPRVVCLHATKELLNRQSSCGHAFRTGDACHFLDAKAFDDCECLATSWEIVLATLHELAKYDFLVVHLARLFHSYCILVLRTLSKK